MLCYKNELPQKDILSYKDELNKLLNNNSIKKTEDQHFICNIGNRQILYYPNDILNTNINDKKFLKNLNKQILNKELFIDNNYKNYNLITEKIEEYKKKTIELCRKNVSKEEVKELVEMLTNITRYVPFNIFLEKLIKQVIDFLDYIKEKKYERIIFIIPGEEYNYYLKSNYWVCQMIVYILFYWLEIKIKISFYYSYEDFNGINDYNKEKDCFLFCDDASYSGIQLSQFIRSFDLIAKSHLGFTNIFSYYLIIPYMTNAAIEDYFSEETFMMFSPEIMLTIDEIVTLTNFDKKKKEEIEQNFNLLYSYDLSGVYTKGFLKTATYFQHKIADNVSTFNNIFNCGYICPTGNLKPSDIYTPIYNELTDELEVMPGVGDKETNNKIITDNRVPFINNCTDTTKQCSYDGDPNTILEAEMNQTIKDLDKTLCLHTFYKQRKFYF